MKLKLTIVLLILGTVCTKAQNKLSGSIQSENKEPIANATVEARYKGKTTATTANAAGQYEFEGLVNGAYEIAVSATGYEKAIEKIILKKNISTTHNFFLVEAATELQLVEVKGRLTQKYISDYSFGATKTQISSKEIPLSISSVTKELIHDRQAFQLVDAVKTSSGVVASSFYNHFSIRGVTQNEEGQIINGLRTRQYFFLQPLTSNIERIEVIKGPASSTFSSVDPGGSINMVTKKPLDVVRREISLSAGSFNTIRGTIDFTGPLNDDKTLLYRINGAYQEAKSYRDLVRNNLILISPSISYIPNEKTAVNTEFIFSNMRGNLDRGQPIFGAIAGATNLNSTPISLNLGASNDFFISKELSITSSLAHKFSKHIAFNTIYMKQTWAEDLQEHRTNNAFAADTSNTPITSLAGMQFIQRKQFWNIDNVNTYFSFDFKTGQATHQLLIGYDLHSWEKSKGGGQNAARGFLLKDGAIATSFVKEKAANYQLILVNDNVLPKPNVPYFDLANPKYTIRNINDYTMNSRIAVPSALTTTNAIYIQEQLRWNKFIVLLGLRNEWFKDITNYNAPGEASFTNIKLIPRIGITYLLSNQVSLYATYLEGYQPQSNTVTLMPNTGAFFQSPKSAALFKPLISDLKEVGAKADLFNAKIRVTSALYEVNQKNLLLNANLPAFPDSLATRGAERSRGFEIDVAGFILPNWQINASYSYIDSRIIEDNDATLKNARKQNTPYNSGSLWTRYNFDKTSPLKDLGLGLGLQHSGNKTPWYTRAFTVPGYTLMDMAIYFNPAKTNMQLSININNVLNQTYWLGAQTYLRLFPGAPRNIMFTATYKF